MYGMLDASADTHWIRVMPVREELFYEPEEIDAVVTLTHLESGHTDEMKDSLITYPNGRQVWNFWSTLTLEPQHSYRITATRSDGVASSAEVTLPQDFDGPIVDIERDTLGVILTARIVIDGVERIADVQTIYTSPIDHRTFAFPQISELREVSSTISEMYLLPEYDYGALHFTHHFEFPPGVQAWNLWDSPSIDPRIFIAGGGPEYPPFQSLSDLDEEVPEGLSNIENGVGFIAGVISKTVPFKECVEVDDRFIQTQRVPCEPVSYPW